jgi:hypothetical protein
MTSVKPSSAARLAMSSNRAALLNEYPGQLSSETRFKIIDWRRASGHIGRVLGRRGRPQSRTDAGYR